MYRASLLSILTLTFFGCDGKAPPDTGNPADADTDTDTDTDTDSDADTDTDTDSDTDADTDTDTDTDTDSDTDSDTDTDSDADTDVHFTCDEDGDGDGVTATDGDCYPSDSAAFPGAAERCNGRDDDCDGAIDEEAGCAYMDTAVDTADSTDTGTPWIPNGDADVDDDGDGFTENTGDCDDTESHVSPAVRVDDCTGPGAGVDNDCDGTVDEDCRGSDTALGLAWYAGDTTVCDGPSFLTGHFGFEITDLSMAPVCVALSEWTSDGTAPGAACPGCEWAFNLSTVNGVSAGSACEGMGITGDIWDGTTFGFGFASEYDYAYGSGVYVLDNTMFYYSQYYGYWTLFSYNYGSYGYNEGDATHLDFKRFYQYVYYYP